MAQDNNELMYFANTYTSFSHNHLIAMLSSNDAQYVFDMTPTEEVYSRFKIMSNQRTYNLIREAIEVNDGNAITIEYGSY